MTLAPLLSDLCNFPPKIQLLHRVVFQIPICLGCNVRHPLFCPVNCPRVAQIQLNETVILYLFNFIGKLRKRRKFIPNVDSYELLQNFHFANCVDPAHAWLYFGEIGLWRMRGPTHGRITTRIWVTATGRINTSKIYISIHQISKMNMSTIMNYVCSGTELPTSPLVH